MNINKIIRENFEETLKELNKNTDFEELEEFLESDNSKEVNENEYQLLSNYLLLEEAERNRLRNEIDIKKINNTIVEKLKNKQDKKSLIDLLNSKKESLSIYKDNINLYKERFKTINKLLYNLK